jgi:hypothetical protein
MLFAQSTRAQESGITLSVSPPLFKIDMQPGQTWKSSVKVVNNNAYPTVIYAQVLDFISGDDGGVQFLPEGDTSHARYSLSKWLKIDVASTTIPAYGQSEVPFTLVSPQDADPGGHYAAIMIGNKPFDKATGGTAIQFSSRLASLLLVRFAGDVKESGEIKEFKANQSLFTKLDGKFSVKFANTGNVHIHPTGEIKITNIFGDVRGEIIINKSADYGNVLPESDKTWQLDWKGTNPILDAGPMKAELLLNYGSDVKASATSVIRFWTFQMKPTLLVLGGVLLIIILVILIIRRYVRKNIEVLTRQIESQANSPKRKKRVVSANLTANKKDEE